MYERVLVPLDGSKLAENALLYVEELVSKLSPEVKVEITRLQVLSPVVHHVVGGRESPNVARTKAELEQLEQKAMDYLRIAGGALRRKGAVVTAKVAVGNPPEEIIKAAEEIKADSIVMSTHGRSGISRWAFGSVTNRILQMEVNTPITVVRPLRRYT